MQLELVSDSPEQTARTGFALGATVQPGTVIALQGPMGGGKTCFVQGIARGMGISDDVVSPTYTLVIPYSGYPPGQYRLLHIDAYRIVDADELIELGLAEELELGAVLAIEWFDRFENEFPPADLKVTFADGDSVLARKILIESSSELGMVAVASMAGTKS